MKSGDCLNTFIVREPIRSSHLCGDYVTLHTRSKTQIIKFSNDTREAKTIIPSAFDENESIIDSVHMSPYGDS